MFRSESIIILSTSSMFQCFLIKTHGLFKMIRVNDKTADLE